MKYGRDSIRFRRKCDARNPAATKNGPPGLPLGCLPMQERERERVCVCVRRERKRKKKRKRKRERVCVCQGAERERERERQGSIGRPFQSSERPVGNALIVAACVA